MARILKAALFTLLVFLAACSTVDSQRTSQQFTLAVIPDTQNYLDYTHQQRAGFAFDASDLFIQQMRHIARRSPSQGGSVAFVASVGDVWQHQSKSVDTEHAERGLGVRKQMPDALRQYLGPKPETITTELPLAIEGYRLLHEAGIPFGVAPGNHDYDAMWSVEGYKPDLNSMSEPLRSMAAAVGMLHIGGLDNFRFVFGADSEFFANKPWYISSYDGGSSSAQTFSAGGYQFLHIALEMQPADEVLAWAESVLAEYPGLPTIVSTHDYLDARGQRVANPLVDLVAIDPQQHNSAQQVWEKFYSQHDQIFLVLCGHHHGQAWRVDENRNGLPVFQVLADYQDRNRASVDAGQAPQAHSGEPAPIGDGWFRMMNFDLNTDSPRIQVKTYSSYFEKYSEDEANYAAWYRQKEQPALSDEEFYQADDFELDLSGFHQRFSKARLADQ